MQMISQLTSSDEPEHILAAKFQKSEMQFQKEFNPKL